MRSLVVVIVALFSFQSFAGTRIVQLGGVDADGRSCSVNMTLEIVLDVALPTVTDFHFGNMSFYGIPVESGNTFSAYVYKCDHERYCKVIGAPVNFFGLGVKYLTGEYLVAANNPQHITGVTLKTQSLDPLTGKPLQILSKKYSCSNLVYIGE